MVAESHMRWEGLDSPANGSTLLAVTKSLSAMERGSAEESLRNTHYELVPSRATLAEVVALLRSAFFPGFFGSDDVEPGSVEYHIGSNLRRAQRLLRREIEKGLSFSCDHGQKHCPLCAESAGAICDAFMTRLPEVRRLLVGDVWASYEGDPAASCPDEVLICYPGIRAITHHRLAHELFCLQVPMLPRIIAEQAHSTTGIDIHPGAHIGERFFMDHGTGIVVGETSQIGNRVRLYQGVTLGAKSFPLDDRGHPIKGIKRHPVVEDDVIIYAGATVLGNITIGERSVVGGNVWVTESCAPDSRITQAQARQEIFACGGGI